MPISRNFATNRPKDINCKLQSPKVICNSGKIVGICQYDHSKKLMRRSNCSAPIPPRGQPRGQRQYACDKKGRGTRKKGDFGDYIGRGK